MIFKHFFILQVYISEIASSRYRGGLCSLQQLSVTIGVFAGFLVGTEAPWRWAAVFPIIVTVIMTIAMFFMPESPRFDLVKGLSQTPWDKWLCINVYLNFM